MTKASLRTASFLVLVVAGALSLSACPSQEVHNAYRAGKQVSDDLHEFTVTVRDMHSSGDLSDDETKVLAQFAIDASKADDNFVTRIETVTKLDPSNKAAIADLAKTLVDDVKRLHDEGVLHISNPASKAKVEQIFNKIDLGLEAVKTLLVTLSSEKIPSKLPPIQGAATGLDLALIAFMKLAQLIAQARKDGSLTDEQLKAAALAENEDTRALAQSLIDSIDSGSSKT
jgi:hypothetical protein